MKLGRNVEVRVFSKEEDDEGKIREKLLSLFPFDFAKEKIMLHDQAASSFNEKKIKIFTVSLQKDRHMNAFMKNFFSRLNDEQKSLLLRQLDSRIDEHFDFFVRLDKEKLLNEDIFWITDSGNCFHVKIGIAAFPSNKFAAKKVIEKLLSPENEN